MKISVSSYSFAQLKKSPVEIIPLAKELGFAAIEYTDGAVPDRETALRVREECERAALPIIAYAIWADFLKAESPSDEVKRVCAFVDIAETLGAKKMRHDVSGGFKAPHNTHKSFDQALPPMAKCCREVAEYAAAKGVMTMVENHGFYCQDSTRVASLVGAVDHPNFGVLADIGNFLCADEDPAIACGRVSTLTRHVHAKDFFVKPGTHDNPGEGWFRSRAGNYLRGAIVGHGAVPVRQCLDIFRRAGYDGYVSIEFEGMENCLDALRIGKKNLETLIA